MTENIAGEGALPIKYDLLNGKPIKDHDFVTRMWNTVIPVSLNLDQGPGRKLLFDSGYDLRMSTYYGPDGTDLTNSPRLRSKFQEYIGRQNLELELNKLSEDPRVLRSLQMMNSDRENGNRDIDPRKAYMHNILIDRLFKQARKKAWGLMKNDERIQALITEERQKQALINRRKQETSTLLQMNR